MQDLRAFQSIKPQFSEQELLKCPRCGSHNTKFCYYNNYNLSQPRHFCKNCRRYWTRGGTLRNIPVGGGIRKTNKKTNPKRPTSSSSSSSTPTAQSTILQTTSAPPPLPSESIDHDRLMMDMNGSFSSLLASNGHFGGLLESMGMTHSVLEAEQFDVFGRSTTSNLNANANGRSMGELRLEMGDSGSWDATNGWPHLSIYTPGSRFQ